MVTRAEKDNSSIELKMSSEEALNKRRKIIQTSLIISLLCLISAVILVSFDLKLLAGCLIIVSASLGLFIYKNLMDLHKRFKESLSEVSLLSRKKDEVINDFSHKIREPLNNLVSIIDLLLESDHHKKQKDLLETFSASTNNMVSTLNELTMKSAGNLSFEKRKNIRFNISSTIQNTIDLYSLKSNVKIEFNIDNNRVNESECLGDPILLKQIFLDLFNTIEIVSPDRVTKVTINLQRVKETEVENIFALGLQTDNKIDLLREIGFERSLAAQLISSLKGTSSQDSSEDSTVLKVLLPYAKPADEPKQNITAQKIEELIRKEKTVKELKDLKILLVEDNLINQKITLLTLKPLVYKLDTASNGKEALDKFGTSNYDLILMDIQMPVMDGLLAAEKIRALESTTHSHVPIIAITANAMIGDKEKCLSAGIDDYISKPFKPSALIEKIMQFV